MCSSDLCTGGPSGSAPNAARSTSARPTPRKTSRPRALPSISPRRRYACYYGLFTSTGPGIPFLAPSLQRWVHGYCTLCVNGPAKQKPELSLTTGGILQGTRASVKTLSLSLYTAPSRRESRELVREKKDKLLEYNVAGRVSGGAVPVRENKGSCRRRSPCCNRPFPDRTSVV